MHFSFLLPHWGHTRLHWRKKDDMVFYDTLIATRDPVVGILDRSEDEKISNLVALTQYSTLKPHDVFIVAAWLGFSLFMRLS